MDDVFSCSTCKMSFIPGNTDDTKKHSIYHRRYLADVEKMMKDQAWIEMHRVWSGELSSSSEYQVAEFANPRLMGFTITGIPDEHLAKFQAGGGIMLETDWSGDGHDRSGEWAYDQDCSYTYHANWRAGMAHFTNVGERKIE